jgi:hypothetical protein
MVGIARFVATGIVDPRHRDREEEPGAPDRGPAEVAHVRVVAQLGTHFSILDVTGQRLRLTVSRCASLYMSLQLGLTVANGPRDGRAGLHSALGRDTLARGVSSRPVGVFACELDEGKLIA